MRDDEIARLRAINAELVEVLTVLCRLCEDRDAGFIDSLTPAHAAIFNDILMAAREAAAKAKDEAD